MRAILVLWHRWFGLFAALWLALMGLTGSAIVFYDELDTWLNQDLRSTHNSGRQTPVDSWIAAAEAHRPGGKAYFADLPNEAGETAYVTLAFPEGEHGPLNVYIDPHSGAVLGERELGVVRFDRRHVMNLLYDLHLDLLLGDTMYWFLGLVAFLWLLDHFLVLGISFPAARQWWQSFLLRKSATGVKFHYDLHRSSGLWFLPLTLILAISALYFNWNPAFEAVVDRVSPITPRHIYTMQEQDTPLYVPPVSFGTALETASQQAGERVDIINYYPYLRAYMARAFDVRDVDSHGRRLLTIDANTGALLADQHAASGSAGDVFMLWQYPLHSGKAFGLPGRLLIFLSGLVLTLLCYTGLVLWWRKRKARGRNSARTLLRNP